MRRIGLAIGGVAAAGAALFLNYYLPSREIVRIVGTEVVRNEDRRDPSGIPEIRDMRLINAVDARGRAVVFRNQDTGWGWPPYFKFNSADLSARAGDTVSTEASPRWMVVTSYGWRINLLTRFPNAVAIRPADSQDETLIPWFNIVFLVLLAAAVLTVRRRIMRLFGD